MSNKFKLYKNKIITAVCGLAFAATLVGCSSNTAENKIENTNTAVTTENVINQNDNLTYNDHPHTNANVSNDFQNINNNTEKGNINQNLNQNDNQTSTEQLNTNTNSQLDKDSAAEIAINDMVDSAKKLKDSASDFTHSDTFKEALSDSLQNVKELSDFVFNGGEINGVTFDELSDKGKESAKNALNSLNDTLEYLVPNYKERFKDWFTDTAAKGLDALSNLKDDGLNLWDEIQSKKKIK